MFYKFFIFVAFLSFPMFLTAKAPGKPIVKLEKNSFALVEIDSSQIAYEKLVKNVYKNIKVNISWNILKGGKPEIARVFFNDELRWEGKGDTKEIFITVSKGGRYNIKVELQNSDGISVSESKLLIVADTDGSHLQPLEFSWTDNNKPYENTTDKIIGSYFVEWGVYGRNYPLNKAPLTNINRILYGFIPICGGDGINDSLKTIEGSFNSLQNACAGREDFKVAIHDPWAAIQKMQIGVNDPLNPYKGNYGQLMAAKKTNPQLKVLASIGGWTLSDPFFFMGDEAKRSVFVDSVKEFLETWKFYDGIDIDFEFPGGGGANPKLGDKLNDGEIYIAILKDLRVMLDELGEQNNRYYELNSAVSASYEKLQLINYKEASQYLDNLYLMAYDFYGSWDLENINHQTGLFESGVNPENDYYASKAIDILEAQGFPINKIVLGVAAFGRGWKGIESETDNLFLGKAKGAIKGTWEEGVLDYRDIAKNYFNKQGFKYGFDDKAKASYLFNLDTGELITYDDPNSVKVKSDYVIQRGLAGIFHWELDSDNGDLINAMHEGFKNKPKN